MLTQVTHCCSRCCIIVGEDKAAGDGREVVEPDGAVDAAVEPLAEQAGEQVLADDVRRRAEDAVRERGAAAVVRVRRRSGRDEVGCAGAGDLEERPAARRDEACDWAVSANERIQIPALERVKRSVRHEEYFKTIE